jgi:hypothetical protein
MIAMTFTIELDIGLSVLLQAALPQLVTDRETKTHRRGQFKRSYGHCRRRTEILEAEPLADPYPTSPRDRRADSGSPTGQGEAPQ